MLSGKIELSTDVAKLPPLYTDRAEPPSRTENRPCADFGIGYCKYTQIDLLAFMKNVESRKISLKRSKMSKSQKMQKNRLANILNILYNKNTKKS